MALVSHNQNGPGRVNLQDLDGELVKDDTDSGRSAHSQALASRPTEDVKTKAWSLIFSGSRTTLPRRLVIEQRDHLARDLRAQRCNER
ncbi:hypothetical protein [Tomitella biformata]|uniref:hypothetical protein n=1 Tax=Tomitella biformata TaxID=630403 RepID=UPI000466BF23